MRDPPPDALHTFAIDGIPHPLAPGAPASLA